jgi:transposase-like protein
MAGPVTGEVVALPAPATLDARRSGRRRRWTLDQKLAIVRESEAGGDPVAVVARRYGMNANHLFIWRQQARAGTLGRRAAAERAAESMRFIDLGVVGQAAAAAAAGAPATIEIVLPSGVIVRAPPGTTSEALRSALTAVKAVLA